jgi:hypothetical protein
MLLLKPAAGQQTLLASTLATPRARWLNMAPLQSHSLHTQSIGHNTQQAAAEQRYTHCGKLDTCRPAAVHLKNSAAGS